MCWVPYARVVVIAAGGANITRIVFPGSGTDDVRRAVVINPSRTIRRCALIIVVPAIGYPLIDIAAHIVQTEGVRLETADLQRLRSVVGFITSFAIGHVCL